MKCSLGISNFLEDICIVSHSIVSLFTLFLAFNLWQFNYSVLPCGSHRFFFFFCHFLCFLYLDVYFFPQVRKFSAIIFLGGGAFFPGKSAHMPNKKPYFSSLVRLISLAPLAFRSRYLGSPSLVGVLEIDTLGVW